MRLRVKIADIHTRVVYSALQMNLQSNDFVLLFVLYKVSLSGQHLVTHHHRDDGVRRRPQPRLVHTELLDRLHEDGLVSVTALMFIIKYLWRA